MSVEDNPEWYRKVVAQAEGNIKVFLVTDPTEYACAILQHEAVDVVIVDGSNRHDCARFALQRLKSGGVIILDNADTFPDTARLLCDAGLIQVDMTGFAPMNSVPHTTSFFFHRDFNFARKMLDNRPN